MTFDQVLVFHRIIKTGSFKAAAAELHRTQPAISLSIKKLEEEMGSDLFDRSGYRPVLTSHGKAFLERSKKVLEGMGELDALTQSFKNHEEPELSIAVDGISPLPTLLKLFKEFSDRFPHTKLNLGFEILSEAERRVLSREAQIGLTHFLSEPGLLEIIPVTSVKMIPVMNTDLYKERRIDREELLEDIHQVVIADKNGPRGASFGLLESGKKWRLENGNFKREIILAGLGWGHLPEHSIERELREKKLTVLDFKNTHPRVLEINLIRLKKHQLGVVGKSLWEKLTSQSYH